MLVIFKSHSDKRNVKNLSYKWEKSSSTFSRFQPKWVKRWKRVIFCCSVKHVLHEKLIFMLFFLDFSVSKLKFLCKSRIAGTFHWFRGTQFSGFPLQSTFGSLNIFSTFSWWILSAKTFRHFRWTRELVSTLIVSGSESGSFIQYSRFDCSFSPRHPTNVTEERLLDRCKITTKFSFYKRFS